MASKTVTRALRSSSRQAIATMQRPAAQRSLTTAALMTAASRPAVARSAARIAVPAIQSRGLKTIDFAGVKEEVYERADWPKEKLLVRLELPTTTPTWSYRAAANQKKKKITLPPRPIIGSGTLGS